ncbi:DUF6880 family protein [Rhodobacter sp. CZR27]|uniref:DUF6880 family protein n=1 Tax=Rhodobacter sp. CZR27 TaxID=2033869 RepID=UPI000BBE52AD|nr:DUF6880 family protein [Rhodobacter sp. CZR27]
MARKPALDIETLLKLGPEKLARLVLDETQDNPGFKRRVSAAVAGTAGPEAIAKIVDRRLAGLERARGFVDWDKARAFADDLRSLVAVIAEELGPADPALAVDRLLRFLVTHGTVFERVDDSSGRVADTYVLATEALGPLVGRLGAAASDLPERVTEALDASAYGYLTPVARAIIPQLPPAVLAAWDADLAARSAAVGAPGCDRWFRSAAAEWAEIRQAIAVARGDLDGLVAIEAAKPDHVQRPLAMAAQLLEAGRAAEALDWVRKEPSPLQGRVTILDDDSFDPEAPAVQRVSLEARILDALGRRDEARALRWEGFAATLSAKLLREHLKSLPDFDDLEAEENALSLALDHPEGLVALGFLLDWNRRDLAARLVIARAESWSGADWYVLPKVADLLQHEHPVAATILYRSLLADILARARSKAYGHGVEYLRRLDQLAGAAEADAAWPQGMEAHAAWRAALKRDHGRKTGFWSQMGESGKAGAAEPERPLRGRAPRWVQSP